MYAMQSSCVFERIIVAFALLPWFWCAPPPVILIRTLTATPNYGPLTLTLSLTLAQTSLVETHSGMGRQP